MLGSAMMKVAESGRFVERRQMLVHFTTELIRSAATRGIGPPFTDEARRDLVSQADKLVRMIEEVAHER